MNNKQNSGQTMALTSGNIKKQLGLFAIAIASCCGWCTASIIVVLRYRGNKWKEKAVVKINHN